MLANVIVLRRGRFTFYALLLSHAAIRTSASRRKRLCNLFTYTTLRDTRSLNKYFDDFDFKRLKLERLLLKLEAFSPPVLTLR